MGIDGQTCINGEYESQTFDSIFRQRYKSQGSTVAIYFPSGLAMEGFAGGGSTIHAANTHTESKVTAAPSSG